MGHYISFTGNITFKNADSIRDVLSKVSVENILLETDSPFLLQYRIEENGMNQNTYH